MAKNWLHVTTMLSAKSQELHLQPCPAPFCAWFTGSPTRDHDITMLPCIHIYAYIIYLCVHKYEHLEYIDEYIYIYTYTNTNESFYINTLDG